MAKDGQQQPESSKDGKRRSKRLRLATLAIANGLAERTGGVKISNNKDVEVGVAPHLPIISHNSTSYPNVNPTISSKDGKRRSKRLRLATLAIANGLAERTGGVKISNNKDVEVGVAPHLPIISHNSTSYPNVNPTISSNPHNSTSCPNVTPTNISNSHNSTSCPNVTRTNTSNPLPNSSFEGVQVGKKKKRGKTMMKSLSFTPTEKVEVEFNELGQPIGKNSTYLSSYLGTLARKMVPMTISDWRLVDKSLKDDLWICIQTRFKLDVLYKSLLTKMLGLRWKEAKSRLVSAIKRASKSPNAANELALLKPDNIKSPQVWNDFIKEKLSEEFELKSNKFKAIREKNKLPHTMSRKGYARLAEDMKKESDCSLDITRDDLWCKGHIKKNGEPPNSVVAECIAKIKEHSSTQSSHGMVSLSEDGVAKTLGREHCGTVRGLGFGVSPSHVGVHMSNSKNLLALKNQVTGLQTSLQQLTDMFMTAIKGNVAEGPVTPCAATSQSQFGSSNFANGGNMHTQDLPKKCKLLNWQKNVVAEGTIASTDPTALVHHVPLGADVWKVWVDVALEPQAFLWRVNSEMSTIQQAVGTTVAWHKDFIFFD